MNPPNRRNGLPPQPLRGYGNEPTRGELNRLAAFTAVDAVRIVKLHAHGVQRKVLADVFGVSPDCISKIVAGKTYFDETFEVRRQIRQRQEA